MGERISIRKRDNYWLVHVPSWEVDADHLTFVSACQNVARHLNQLVFNGRICALAVCDQPAECCSSLVRNACVPVCERHRCIAGAVR